ncbi:MAG: phenylalanine--tRNA ligase subunit beta [Bdellovibrionaceae bacterium]|nr:phenylalanine--tRNA ligase subunit beta [Pseudobdellovibrionaceae bacterium]
MKISLNWLNEYIDVSDFFSKPQELSDLLTRAGLEVDGYEDLASQFSHVVVAQVKVLERHPDADKLTLCQVDVGSGEDQQIICGAKNHKQGDKVVAALPGAILPGDFKIKVSKIRGIESRGMLCSETELGVADSADGILLLPTDAPVGKPYAEYAGLNDIIFEISVTPNRADCLSHLGLARELGAVLGRDVKIPEPQLKTGSFDSEQDIQVQLNQSESCPRYSGRSLRGIKVGPSPAWLKSRLELVGMNSINNVVDVTNFVMLELGQPLHAFDQVHLQGNKIIIDTSKAGEGFTTLDGTELKMSGDELTIRDQDKPVALAGIVGGKNSGVSESTTDIFVESANFNQKVVRRTARRFGIDTESGQRFSRGTNPEIVLLAMDRACQLIQQLCGGEVAKTWVDHYPKAIEAPVIEISQPYVEQRLGYKVPAEDFEMWMGRLGCDLERTGEGQWSVRPPVFRWDLAMDVDLVEEYARLHGYEHIPERLPVLDREPSQHDRNYLNERRLTDLCVTLGYLQAVNYSFLSEAGYHQFIGDVKATEASGVPAVAELVKIRNPLNEELNAMRGSMAPGLYKNALDNFRYGNLSGRLFEIGRVFSKKDDGFSEATRLGFVNWGLQQAGMYKSERLQHSVLELKTSVEKLLEGLSISRYSWDQSADLPEFLHPGQSAVLVVEGKPAGYIGTLHPSLREKDKWRVDLSLAEINAEKLMLGQPRKSKFKPLAKYQVVERDFSVVIPDDMPVGQVMDEVQKSVAAFLVDAQVFDVFKGKGLPEGHRSVSIKLRLQSAEKTLDEQELAGIQEAVIQKLADKLGVHLR